MTRTSTRLLGVLLLMCCYGPSKALACIWPPPVSCVAENANCPLPGGYNCDTLLLDNCQNPAAVPFAATGDSVDGVGGIVTAIDAIPTGFSFYLQRTAPAGTKWCGADVFTGGSNIAGTKGLLLGDSVVVYGAMAEFGGGTEIQSRNANFTTPNIIVRKVSTGNPVPPFHVGTDNELKFVSNNPNAEQWEGMLVRIASKQRVVRHTGLGTNAIPGANCIVVDDAICPTGSIGVCDSVIIQTADLAGLNAPPVGSFMPSVQGIYDQRSINGNTNYEILPRNSLDMPTTQPPHVADAYSVHQDTVRVVFDQQVTALTAQNINNYTYPSLTSVISATLESNNKAVDLAISPAVADGAVDQITVNNITSAENDSTMTAGENHEYVQSVVSIQSIQGPNPDSLSLVPCEDVGNYLGNNNGSIGNIYPDNLSRLTYRGVCIGGVGNVYYIEAPGGGLRSGVSVFAPIVPLVTGHQYLIASQIQEFPGLAAGLSETEAQGTVYIRDEGVVAVPAPATVPISQINAVAPNPISKCTTPSGPSAEDYEGVLVRVAGVKIAYRTNNWDVPRAAGTNFHVTGPYPACPDTIPVHLTGQGVTFAPTDGHIVNVTGILHLNFGAFEIYPRTNADITDVNNNAVTGGVPAEMFLSLGANPSRNPRINFGLPRDANVELSVFDVAGRKLIDIEKGNLPAGSYSRVWDGATRAGGSAGTGLYFFRLKVGNEIRTVQAVRLR